MGPSNRGAKGESYLLDDRFGGGARVGCCGDRPADYNVVSSGADGGGGGGHLSLVVLVFQYPRGRQTHPGNDDEEILATGPADSIDRVGRGDNAIKSSLFGQPCELH